MQLRMMNSVRSIAVAACFLAFLGSAFAQEPQKVSSTPIAPTARPDEWAPSPGQWQETQSAEIEDRQGTTWQVIVGTRLLGSLTGAGNDVPVHFPRLSIGRFAGSELKPIAVLLPIDSRDVELVPPDSPAISDVPEELAEDSIDRWPNPCSFTLLDVTGLLDLDADGSIEIAVRRFCSCPAVGCSEILLVELDPDGPNILYVSSLVRDVSLQRVTLDRIKVDADSSRPKLEVSVAYLEDCRFVTALGIRGAAGCLNCCQFPVLLRPVEDGQYETYYDRSVQRHNMRRAMEDMAEIAEKDMDAPLAPDEITQIARAASFFYLTGGSTASASVVLEGLGMREKNYRVNELVMRLDRFFSPAE